MEAAAAVARGDADAAAVEFRTARDLFVSAHDRLASPFAWPLRVTPVASTHVDVGSALSRAGVATSSAGLVMTDAMNALPDGGLSMREGKIDLTQLGRARDVLRSATGLLPDIERAVDDMPGDWVVQTLAGPRDDARSLLPSVVDGVRKADAALEALPSILGSGGRKRYLVAFSNLSELRGSGGLFGYVTALGATDGKLDLEELSGRPTEILPAPGDVGLTFPDWFPADLKVQAEIFQNINLSTDFPTVGSLVLQTAQARVGALDGVIAVDPQGIVALLRVVGPVTVKSWPRPLDADNAAEVLMNRIYIEKANNNERDVFFEEVVRAAFDKLTNTSATLTPSVIGAFDAAVAGGHFRMFSKHEADQRAFQAMDADGSVARAEDATDVVGLVSTNATGNKGDWYLRRQLQYTVTLDPSGGSATGAFEASLHNSAPSTGLPEYVIGSPLEGLAQGTNRQIVTVLRSRGSSGAQMSVDGRDVGAVDEREGHLIASRAAIDIEAQRRGRVAFTSTTPGALRRTEKGELVYRLRVLRQPVARSDFAVIEVHVPRGWEAFGRTTFSGDLERDVVLEVRLRRSWLGRIADAIGFG
jgi:hypothetical protein